MKDIKTIVIVGAGLIGGSFGLAIKKKYRDCKVIGFGRDLNRLKSAKKIGAVDWTTLNLKDAVSNADVVILCLPVKSIIKFAIEILQFVKKGCIITDVGSTKKEIVESLENKMPDDVHFIGAHPLAGSHNSGVKFANDNLFKNTVCIVTPTKATNRDALNTIKSIWTKIGAKVIFISPDEHDKLIAKTSHLPHIISVSLISTVLDNLIRKIQPFIASGFKDTTRISASNPVLWRDICVTNRVNIIRNIEKFEKHLAKIKNVLKKNNGKILLNLFKLAKEKREKI